MDKTLRILFVEDREDDMMLVLRALSKGGYEIRYSRVQDEETLREILKTQEWDAVIADYSMPGFSGSDALSIFSEAKLDIPFILVSGSVAEDIAIKMMQTGAGDYISKDKLARIVPALERELMECELRRKKKAMEDELYRASLIIDSTDVILWQWVPQTAWQVKYVSRNVSQFGYSPDDFLSGAIKFHDFVHPDDRDVVFQGSLENIAKHRDLYKQQYRVICKNGDEHWLDDYTTVVRDATGEVVVIQGITYDVTDSVLMSRDLEHSKNLYRNLVDTSPDGICMLDMDFNMVFVNKRKVSMFGYDTPEEMLGMPALKTLAPEYHQFIQEQSSELFCFGRLSVSDLEFLRKDGSRFYGELRMVLIRDEEANPINIINLVTDTTDRKEMQESLIESENRFRVSFEHAPIGMDMLDLNGVITRANKAFCDLVGYSEDELQKLSFYTITHPDDREENRIAVEKLLNGDADTISLEKRYIRKDGQVIWVKVSSALIRNPQGKPTYFLAQVEDITRNKQVEQEILNAKQKAEESDRLKSALLKNMSHELRTPLNGIMGFSELIRKADLNPEVLEMAELIHRSGKRLMTTLDSIMLLAQLESNRKAQDLSFTMVNISKELDSICMSYRDEIVSKGFEFIIDIEPGIMLLCETKLLRQAFTKILENAIKFTHEGKVEVILKIRDKTEVLISISDTGIGLDDAMKREIFTEFRQGSEGYGRAYEGSGLGLSITKKIIDLFGGTITVESEQNVGSTFSIALPYTDSGIKAEASRPIKAEPVVPAVSSDTLPPLLIVEDNPVNQKLAKSFLKHHYEVDTAATGEIAVEMVKEKHYNVILMDINLGSGMDGLQTTQVIRKMEGYATIPIIAVTGYTLIGDRERILEGGCTHYLGKPFSKDQLLETIEIAKS